MGASGDSTSGEGAVSFDSVLAGAKPTVKRTRISMRGDLVDQLEQLEIALHRARISDEMENSPAKAPGLAAQIVGLTTLAREAEVEFVFTAMGRRPWRDLIAAHPPTEEQAGKGADFNPETLPAAAMAACCISPTGATVEKFEALRDGDVIGDAQWNELWTVVHAVNTGGAQIPLSVAAFALVRGTGVNSERPETTESLAASS
jgi:hypothetical protein